MPGPATDAAMRSACEWAAAIGRAQRVALDMCQDSPFDWPHRRLIASLLMWAWSTRRRRDLIPFYRDRARDAVAAYRAAHLRRRRSEPRKAA